MMGGVVIALMILAGFYGVGYLIAARWKKPPSITALYAALIGLGLFCLCAAVLFGACLCALGNMKI